MTEQQPHRHRAERMGGDGRLAADVPAPRPRRQGDAGRRRAASPEVSHHDQPHGRHVHPHRGGRSGPPSRRRPTWPSWSRITRAARPSPQGEAFDPTAENIDKRVQLPSSCPAASRLALLPRRRAASACTLDLTLHYGNAESLKGHTSATPVPGPADGARHQEAQPASSWWTSFNRLEAHINAGGLIGRCHLLDQLQPRQPAEGAGLAGGNAARADVPGERVQHPQTPAFASSSTRARPSRKSRAGARCGASCPRIRRTMSAMRRRSRNRSARWTAVTLDQVRKLYAEQLGGTAWRTGGGRRLRSRGRSSSRWRRFLKGWKAAVPYQRIERRP